jgi:ATP-dependent protease HslVU (ClpYQ) peptidase subunit
MTTIAAVQGSGWAVVGFDSRVVDDERVYLLPFNAGKVVKNGDYLLGAAGDMRAINLLGHVLKPPPPNPRDEGVRLDRFISSKFIPALKSCFDDAQYGEKGEHDSHIICVVNGVIYDIGSNYDWCRDADGIYAAGTGAGYALGALQATLEGKKRSVTSARNMVKSAVSIACRFDSNSAEPVHLLVQKKEES